MTEASPGERAAAVRGGAGLFAPDDRGLVAVRGGDRVRWLDGMLSNRVADLAPGSERSGCYALLLTPQGRIVADVHVVAREEEVWLETRRAGLAEMIGRLERYVIADDVTLADRSNSVGRLALEGPRAPDVLERAAGAPFRLGPDGAADVRIAGTPVCVGAWGFGPGARQLLIPSEAGGAALETSVAGVRRALEGAAAEQGVALVAGDAATLEVLRVEAGVPRLGAELSEDVLPGEAGLVGRAVSLSKGCFTGQEIVARMASRGRVGHHLVGLRFEEPGAASSDPLPPPGTALEIDGRRVGELTSACRSALAGAIGLGYVRHGHEEPGTAVAVGGARALVAPLPLVAPPG